MTQKAFNRITEKLISCVIIWQEDEPTAKNAIFEVLAPNNTIFKIVFVKKENKK